MNIAPLAWDFLGKAPFDHCVIDDFFAPDFARELAEEFPLFNQRSETWHCYDSPLEKKLTCNDWNRFGPATYRALSWLNSPAFVDLLRLSINADPLYSDPGLHGGGQHAHGKGGKLNVHLDYSLHPKLGLQRKLNLLVYLNPEWEEGWGGHLGLWEQNPVQRGPGALAKSIAPRFNRAVLFDTTQNSWHGLPDPIQCPPGQVRKSLAVYYLTEPDPVSCENRSRALFAPAPEQIGDAEVMRLIEQRANDATAASVYRTREAG